MELNNEKLLLKFDETLKANFASYDRTEFDREFDVAFKKMMSNGKFPQFEEYFRLVVQHYIHDLDLDAFDSLFLSLEMHVVQCVKEFKENTKAFDQLKGVNITYYWEPPSVVDVELYMCSHYASEQGSLRTDWYACGDFGKFEIYDLSKFGYPEYGNTIEYNLAGRFLQVSIFSRTAKILEQLEINYVPFSTSLYCGALDAELPPANNRATSL